MTTHYNSEIRSILIDQKNILVGEIKKAAVFQRPLI